MAVTENRKTSRTIACDLNAIHKGDRQRYAGLTKRLRNAVQARSELRNGYVFHLNPDRISLPEVAEWIGMERLCCPFLVLQLSASVGRPDWLLKLTGPKGVKALLQAEFPGR